MPGKIVRIEYEVDVTTSVTVTTCAETMATTSARKVMIAMVAVGE